MQDLKTLASEQKYAGKLFTVVVDEIEYPSGNRGVRAVIQHPGGAVIVPLTDDGSVILIKQFRYPLKQEIYELPAGKLEPNEDPKVCAARELEEETGFSAASLEHLTSIYTTPGFCDEKLHIFLARGIRPVAGGPRREEGEMGMTTESVPLARAIQMILDEKIVDGKTIAGLFLAERKLNRG